MHQRVAPRIITAEAILLVTMRNQRILSKDVVTLDTDHPVDLPKALLSLRLDTLVCGGISRETKKALLARSIHIIDNVACTIEEALKALESNALKPGFGFLLSPAVPGEPGIVADQGVALSQMDCIECHDRVCLNGLACPPMKGMAVPDADGLMSAMLDAAADVSMEQERTLCRISELVYFSLEMNYKKIGIAFCADLLEQAGILAQLLRRQFSVFPVICKAGGATLDDPYAENDRRRSGLVACNPVAQAEILNRIDTDLNVIVGLCMGVDCLFSKASRAPVTTLFVKDKSLANNPIGALYSEYYLKEVTQTPVKNLSP